MSQNSHHRKTIGIIGVCNDKGASLRGASVGPYAIREAGLYEALNGLGLPFSDCGDVVLSIGSSKTKTVSNLKNLDDVNEVNSKLFNVVSKTLVNGQFPLILGGDHSLAAASVLAVAKHYKKIGLIWVDTHGDFNSKESSPSGNIHGTPLSAVTGNGPNEILPFLEENAPLIDAKKTVIIGARDFDDEEKKRIRKAGVTVFSIEDIDIKGMSTVIAEAVKIAAAGTEGIYLSFDLDVIDPMYAPGVSTPVTGGLTFREAHLLCEYLASSGELLGAEFVELNPLTDDRNRTGKLAVQLIASLMGKKIY